MSPYYHPHTILYLNGNFVKAAEATMDFYSQSLHYGYSVFEGIRAYANVEGQTKIFKAEAHFERLEQSALAINLPYTYITSQLIEATYLLLQKNNLQDAYVRPVVYAPANMSFSQNAQSFIVIQAWEMQPFLGEKLIKVCTSSFERPNPKAFKITAKAAGHYVNSILASQEAKAKGYDEALLNDMHGNVAEGPGANIFYEKNSVLYTPPAGHILPGITRATVLDICTQLSIPVEEKKFTTQELQQADAAFFCGTAAEIIGFESLNDTPFAKPWNETLCHHIQLAYKNLTIEKPLPLVHAQ
jgi:branched-chain amino acid aminotransferase